jgi:GTPase SAR1 family protein
MTSTTLSDFKARQEQLAASLEGAADLIGQLGQVQLADQLRTQASQARQFTFRVGIIGEFSSGKSTLLNALLGQELLPAKMPPCTALPVSIRYGERTRLVVRHKNTGVEEEQPFEKLRELVSLKGETEEEVFRERQALPIESITLEVPLELCRNGVVLLDSPGLNEAQARTELTLSLLPTLDAAIMLLRATSLLSQTERSFLEEEARKAPADRRWMDHAFVAVNFADVALQDNGNLTELRQRLDKFCDDLSVWRDAHRSRRHFIDARSALLGRLGRRGSSDGVEFARFESALSDFLVHERGEAGLRSQLVAALGRTQQADAALTAETMSMERQAEALAADVAQARAILQRERERIQRMAAAMRQMGQRFGRELSNEFIATANEWIQKDLPGYLESLVYQEHILVRVDPAIKWYARHAMQWFEARVQHWANTVPAERLQEFITGFEQSFRDDFRALRQNLRGAAGQLGLPDFEADDKDEGAIAWMLRSAAGFLVGGPLGIAVASVMGWQGILTNLGINFGLALAAAMLGFSVTGIGWVVIAAAVGAAQIFLGQDGIKERLREKVVSEVQSRVPAKLTEIGQKLTGKAEEQITELAEKILGAGEAMIAQLEDTARVAEQNAQANEETRRERARALAAAQEELRRLRAHWEASLVSSSAPGQARLP